MAAPNVVNVSSILGKTSVLSATTTPTDVVSNASSSDKLLKVNLLVVSNIDGGAAADVSASLYRGSTEYYLARTVSVPADASIDLLPGTLYLEEGDSIRITAGANWDLQVVASYEEIDDA